MYIRTLTKAFCIPSSSFKIQSTNFNFDFSCSTVDIFTHEGRPYSGGGQWTCNWCCRCWCWYGKIINISNNSNNRHHYHHHDNNNGNFVCVFECTVVNLATYWQFTNVGWDWIIQKKKRKKKERKIKEKKRKEIKIALSLGYPNSYFYNKRCIMLL